LYNPGQVVDVRDMVDRDRQGSTSHELGQSKLHRPQLASHEVVKKAPEQFLKRLPAMCFCFELPFGREETLCDFSLLCGLRNWHRPRFQEANVNVLLCPSRGKAVHLVLLCPQVKSKILVGKTTSRCDANETIGECTVKIEDPGVADVSRNCQNDCAFRKHPTDG